MAEAARMHGLDVTTQRVLSRGNMRWFERWYYGGLSTGYLIRRLGLKPLRREIARDTDTGP